MLVSEGLTICEGCLRDDGETEPERMETHANAEITVGFANKEEMTVGQLFRKTSGSREAQLDTLAVFRFTRPALRWRPAARMKLSKTAEAAIEDSHDARLSRLQSSRLGRRPPRREP